VCLDASAKSSRSGTAAESIWLSLFPAPLPGAAVGEKAQIILILVAQATAEGITLLTTDSFRSVLAFLACIAYNVCMQYTIRNVPHNLDEALRRAAREQGKSLNDVAIEALARGAGVTGERAQQRDLRDIAGTWRKDPAFDRAVAAQDTIDEEMWK
jgi:plasmid stability protein